MSTKRNWLAGFLVFLSTAALAAGPLIWSGSNAKDLTSQGVLTPGVVLPENGLVANADRITLRAPVSVTPYTLFLPSDDGTVDQVLTTDGSGNLTWSTPSASPCFAGGSFTYCFDGSGITDNRTYVVPDENGIVVLNTATQTLSNKTAAGLVVDNFLDLFSQPGGSTVGIGLYEDPDIGGDGVTFVAPDSVTTGGWIWTIPPDNGDAGNLLQTDGAGVSTWVSALTGLTQINVDNIRLNGGTVDTTSGNLSLSAAGGQINVLTVMAAGELSAAGPFSAGNATQFSVQSNGTTVIDGTADVTQFRVQANATQTSQLVVVEDSAGTDYLSVSGTGFVTVNTVAVTNNLDIASPAGSVATVTFFEDPDSAGGNTVTVSAPDDATNTWSFRLPPDEGDAGEFLTTDGTGVSTWTRPQPVREVGTPVGTSATCTATCSAGLALGGGCTSSGTSVLIDTYESSTTTHACRYADALSTCTAYVNCL